MLYYIIFSLFIKTIDLNAKFVKEESNGKGGTNLTWSKSGTNSKFIVYQKKEGENIWKSISTFTKGQIIKVLNVYPVDNGCGYTFPTFCPHENVVFTFADGTTKNMAKSASLKVWMEGGKITQNGKVESFMPAGYDKDLKKQLIYVDVMDVCEFETNPNVVFNYDCFFFGTWDNTAGQSISSTAAYTINEFIKDGNGAIVGHDVITFLFENNGLTKYRKSFGITINSDDPSISSNYFLTTTVKILKKGIITNYPHEIGEVGGKLTVPTTHTSYQRVSGDVWLNLEPAPGGYHISRPVSETAYLSTHNNTALIQTGHSSCRSSEEERKVIANLIYYLSQKTEQTTIIDHSSQDLSQPTVNLDCISKLKTIQWNGKDSGSTYHFKVIEYDCHSSTPIAESKTVSVFAETGIKEYLYKISSNPNDVIKGINDKTFTHTNNTNYIFKSYESGNYFYLSAIDFAGNLAKLEKCIIPPNPTQSPLPPQNFSNLENANTVQKVSKNVQYTIIIALIVGIALVTIVSIMLYKRFSKIEVDEELKYKNGLNINNTTVNYENPLFNNDSKDDPFDDDFQ